MEDIVIKWNNAAVNGPCAICGERTDPPVGPWLFLEGTWCDVCDNCARQHNPALYRTVLLIHGKIEEARAVVGDYGNLLLPIEATINKKDYEREKSREMEELSGGL